MVSHGGVGGDISKKWQGISRWGWTMLFLYLLQRLIFGSTTQLRQSRLEHSFTILFAAIYRSHPGLL